MVAAILQAEANVIDEELLAQALVEEESDGKDKMKVLGLPDLIMQAPSLKLSFRHIRKIDNLEGFRSLTKLCLDNNNIDKIEQIGFLVNLTWLDLSFNQIEKIEGLSTLTKLTDLSLFSNKIREVEGLESCPHLQCLSLGNNEIATLDSISRLRRFERLKLLNLEGNPVCREAEYRMMVLAFLNQLKYLDYSMVQKDEVVAAREQFQSDLIDLEKKDAIEKDKANLESQAAQVSQQLVAANLQMVELLFNDMFNNDAEMAKLKYLPGIQDHIDQFKINFAAIAESFKANGLLKHSGKTKQVESLNKALSLLREKDVTEQRQIIEGFIKLKKHTLKEVGESQAQYVDIEPLQEELDRVYDELMALEVWQMDQFEDLLNEFEGKYGELKNHCLDLQQTFFRGVEEQEALFTQNLVVHANDLLEKAGTDGLPEDLAEEAETLLMDRDSLMEIINGAHDNRIGVILKKEDETRAKEDTGFTGQVSRYREEGKTRNRNRVLEIQDFLDHHKKQLHDLVQRNAQEEYDEHEAV